MCPQSVTLSPGGQALMEAWGLPQGCQGPWNHDLSPEGQRRLREVQGQAEVTGTAVSGGLAEWFSPNWKGTRL